MCHKRAILHPWRHVNSSPNRVQIIRGFQTLRPCVCPSLSSKATWQLLVKFLLNLTKIFKVSSYYSFLQPPDLLSCTVIRSKFLLMARFGTWSLMDPMFLDEARLIVQCYPNFGHPQLFIFYSFYQLRSLRIEFVLICSLTLQTDFTNKAKNEEVLVHS